MKKRTPFPRQTFKSGLKINLNLHITARRDNGYHELSSLVVFCKDVGDVITIESESSLKADKLTITGQFASELAGERLESNLIIKALQILRFQNAELPFFNIHLAKETPIASGLGGGSCDAAAVVRHVADYYDLTIMEDDFLALGADLPVCVSFKNVIMRGIGEQLEPLLNLPEFHILLVNPLKKVSAAETYKLFKLSDAPFSDDINVPPSSQNFDDWASYFKNTKNDLLLPALQICPDIQEIIHMLQRQNESVFAGMSGSGATCFSLFQSEESAMKAIGFMQEQFKDFWFCSAKIAKN